MKYDYLMTPKEKAQLDELTVESTLEEDLMIRKQKPFEDDFIQEAMEMTLAKMRGEVVDLYEKEG